MGRERFISIMRTLLLFGVLAFLVAAIAAVPAEEEEDPELDENEENGPIEDSEDSEVDDIMDDEDPGKRRKRRRPHSILLSKGQLFYCRNAPKKKGDEAEDDVADDLSNVDFDDDDVVSDGLESLDEETEDALADPKKKKKPGRLVRRFRGKLWLASILRGLYKKYLKKRNVNCFCTRKPKLIKLFRYIHFSGGRLKFTAMKFHRGLLKLLCAVKKKSLLQEEEEERLKMNSHP